MKMLKEVRLVVRDSGREHRVHCVEQQQGLALAGQRSLSDASLAVMEQTMTPEERQKVMVAVEHELDRGLVPAEYHKGFFVMEKGDCAEMLAETSKSWAALQRMILWLELWAWIPQIVLVDFGPGSAC